MPARTYPARRFRIPAGRFQGHTGTIHRMAAKLRGGDYLVTLKLLAPVFVSNDFKLKLPVQYVDARLSTLEWIV
ncbi:MAG: hypothetical protein M3Q08_18490 [Pseudomonadota bacterium]|nr:hypothetical protein [Pseudomonadota bacterium]